MARKLIAALAATAGLALATQAGATVFTLDSINVSGYSVPPNPNSDNGLQIEIIDHVAAAGGYTFDLAATDPQSFDLFTIYTPEGSLNFGEDDNPKPISLSFNFSAPSPNVVGDIDGDTTSELNFAGWIVFPFIPNLDQVGYLTWDTGTTAFNWGPGNSGLMTITVNGGEFNRGNAFGFDEGPGEGLLVRATFDWDRDPTGAIPEPATWALMIGGFGMAGAMMRRRRALALG